MPYVDGFVVPVPRRKVDAYRAMARKAGKVWLEHGALQFRECVADDMNAPWGVAFPKLAKAKPDETVVFAYVVFKNRAHRDRVNAKVMKDERLSGMNMKEMPFDTKKMAFGKLVRPQPGSFVNDLPEHNGKATAIGKLRVGRGNDWLFERVSHRIVAAVHGHMIVADVVVGIRPFVPGEAGRHGKQMLQAKRVPFSIRKDVGVFRKESREFFIYATD